MTIALGTNWGHNFVGGASAVSTSSAAPTTSTEWICGWITTSGTLVNVVDSVAGTVPSGQIINMGADAGASGFTTYFFYALSGSTTARTITANTASSLDKTTILAFSFTGLAASNIVDQAPTPGNKGTGTTPATQSVTTTAPSEVVLFYWMLDHQAAATAWSGASMSGFTGGTFAGLGNLANSAIAQFDAGYYVLSSAQTGSGSVTSSLSDAWMGCIVTLSATAITGAVSKLGLLLGVGS